VQSGKINNNNNPSIYIQINVFHSQVYTYKLENKEII